MADHEGEFRDGTVHQIVIRGRAGRGMAPDTFTMSRGECDELIKNLELNRHVYADPDESLAQCVNLHHAVFGERAIVIYRRSELVGMRKSAIAHVLLGPSDVLSPENVVPMLMHWPWSSEREDDTGRLRTITYSAVEAAAHSIRAEFPDPRRSPELFRLIAERVCSGEEGLVVKVRPGLRAELVWGLYRALGGEALARGFSFHENAYDDKQTLPGLVFVSDWMRSDIEISRRLVDLSRSPAAWAEERVEVVRSLVDAFREHRVRETVDGPIPGSVDQYPSIGDLLVEWDVLPARSRSREAAGQAAYTGPTSTVSIPLLESVITGHVQDQPLPAQFDEQQSDPQPPVTASPPYEELPAADPVPLEDPDPQYDWIEPSDDPQPEFPDDDRDTPVPTPFRQSDQSEQLRVPNAQPQGHVADLLMIAICFVVVLALCGVFMSVGRVR